MSLDWCLGIREACAHWRGAPMLQHAFDELEQDLDSYIEAMNAARGAAAPFVAPFEEQGES